MGLLAEMEEVRNRRRRQRDAVAAIRDQLAPFTRDEQLAILDDVTSALETQFSSVSVAVAWPTPAPINDAGASVESSVSTDNGRSDKVVAMLKARPGGVTVSEIAMALHGSLSEKAKHNTRATLHYLKTRRRAHSIGGGTWVLGPATQRPEVNEEDDDTSSATPIVRRVINEATRELSSSEVMTAVIRINSQIPKTHVYSALHKLSAPGGDIIAHGPPGKHTYSAANRNGRGAEGGRR